MAKAIKSGPSLSEAREHQKALTRRLGQRVLYHTPFGQTVTMNGEQARFYMNLDTERFNTWRARDLLTPAQLEHGPPRIEVVKG